MTTPLASEAVPSEKAFLVTVIETYRVSAADQAEAVAYVEDLRSGRTHADSVDVQAEELAS